MALLDELIIHLLNGRLIQQNFKIQFVVSNIIFLHVLKNKIKRLIIFHINKMVF